MPRVTIIETGLVSPKNRELHGSYPQMFEQMIGAADATVTFNTVSIPAGEPLPDIEGLEAILITGSSAGVYDGFDWIAPLEAFVRAAHREQGADGRRLLRPSIDRAGVGRHGAQVGERLGARDGTSTTSRPATA